MTVTWPFREGAEARDFGLFGLFGRPGQSIDAKAVKGQKAKQMEEEHL